MLVFIIFILYYNIMLEKTIRKRVNIIKMISNTKSNNSSLNNSLISEIS